MDHPRPYSDTDPRAMEVWIDLLRKQRPGDKLRAVLTMANGGHAQLFRNISKKYPTANGPEIFRRVAALNIGNEVAFQPMEDSPRGTPSEGLRRLLAAIDRLEIPYFIGGSVASSTYGIERFTKDVDLVMAVVLDRVEELAGELAKEEFYADAGMMRDGIRYHRAFNVIYRPCVYKYDIFPLQDDDYSRAQFLRRRFEETTVLGELIECAMAAPEDVILSKLRWYRLGGETSEQQWNDLRGVVQVSGAQLDHYYLNEWAPRLRVADLLDRLLKESR
jgi:hypothetical protein